jgi:hypothetical protein
MPKSWYHPLKTGANYNPVFIYIDACATLNKISASLQYNL